MSRAGLESLIYEPRIYMRSICFLFMSSANIPLDRDKILPVFNISCMFAQQTNTRGVAEFHSGLQVKSWADVDMPLCHDWCSCWWLVDWAWQRGIELNIISFTTSTLIRYGRGR